ncbi:tetraacyldisaccharide 4'-kinase [Oricola thermophila]|uniref:Tetraacyldisaccharide 4'-kinase n=1 Tax=Oricola thermophila TaxID=2742145 RepID=A0A6N1VIM0_9HYPH|nr:tetraacyldisaccharide 4'-kinase [Oricola thermophila]QKV19202.1 tetraacyldisaccharide 4'-kinase [Oricola thermophila]
MAGSEAPPFWFRPRGWQSRLLAPASWAYGAVARYRMDRARPPEVMAPVLCIGNLTVGGSGKTPTAIAVGKAVIEAGYRAGFLTRGYGGSVTGPHRVDLDHDTALTVGDEPLLLARTAPTVVASRRAAGARHLIEMGVDFVIMDDGFQSRSVHYDYALIALDARRGIGNGAVIPAGPLRAPMIDQMRHADALLRIGDGEAGETVIRAAARAAKPIMRAGIVPRPLPALEGRPLLAFSGIGEPEKFFDTLRGMGHWLTMTRAYGDHHVFTEADAEDLLLHADLENLELVTTEKDAARLTYTEGRLGELRRRAHVLAVELAFESPVALQSLIEEVAERYHRRRIRRSGPPL